MGKLIKIGHRGANGYEGENSLASFEKAIAMGADAIELDLQMSLDRELMVIHDDTIDRTTNGKGVVSQMRLKELKSFELGNQQKVPTLKEVLDLVNCSCSVIIELKNPDTVRELVALIDSYIDEKAWNYRDFMVSSFHWKALEAIRLLNKSIRIGVLTETDLEQAISFARLIKAESLHPDFRLLSPESTALIQQQGMLLFPWTVNEFEDIQQMKSFEVDGIITDYLDRL